VFFHARGSCWPDAIGVDSGSSGRRAFDVETTLPGILPFYFAALIWHLEETGAGRLWQAWAVEFPCLSAWTAKSLAFESIVTVVELVCEFQYELRHLEAMTQRLK
jgi:hypothetical protein